MVRAKKMEKLKKNPQKTSTLGPKKKRLKSGQERTIANKTGHVQYQTRTGIRLGKQQLI